MSNLQHITLNSQAKGFNIQTPPVVANIHVEQGVIKHTYHGGPRATTAPTLTPSVAAKNAVYDMYNVLIKGPIYIMKRRNNEIYL